MQAAPADNPGKVEWVKFIKATADVNPPETPLDAIYDDKSSKQRVTGPVSFAIDGKDDTAWGIDVGPGRRNQPRKAVFLAEKPIAHPKGTILTFHLTQNHGGWNSDDNQNHNLGRFRLSITTQPGAEADPLPPACAASPGPAARPPDAGAGGSRLQLLAHDGARMEGRQRPDRGTVAEASGRLVAAGAASAADSRATRTS